MHQTGVSFVLQLEISLPRTHMQAVQKLQVQVTHYDATCNQTDKSSLMSVDGFGISKIQTRVRSFYHTTV